MQSNWLENMSDKRKAIEELSRGRDFTNQLRDLLNKSLGDEGLLVGEDLVTKILNSFANTLSMLRNISGDYDEVSQKPRNSLAGRKSEDSDESIKSSKQKDRRGCSKRKKCADSYTRDTPTLADDGHAWRKYGQKVILNAKHPRNYYRCTHKTDQGCQALKQVQQIEDEPPKYRTTYYCLHTCRNLLKASLLILDCPPKDPSKLLSFANNNNNSSKQDNLFLSSFPSVKLESKEPNMPTSGITYNRSSLSSDYLLSPDDDHLTTFMSSAPMKMLSDAETDVISGVDSVDFDDLEF